jgi:hypothetical protein
MKWLKLARDRLLSTGSELSVSAIGDEFTDWLNYYQLLTTVTVALCHEHTTVRQCQQCLWDMLQVTDNS